MNRNDVIEQILEQAIALAMYSQLYMDRLLAMTDAELKTELQRVNKLTFGG